MEKMIYSEGTFQLWPHKNIQAPCVFSKNLSICFTYIIFSLKSFIVEDDKAYSSEDEDNRLTILFTTPKSSENIQFIFCMKYKLGRHPQDTLSATCQRKWEKSGQVYCHSHCK